MNVCSKHVPNIHQNWIDGFVDIIVLPQPCYYIQTTIPSCVTRHERWIPYKAHEEIEQTTKVMLTMMMIQGTHFFLIVSSGFFVCFVPELMEHHNYVYLGLSMNEWIIDLSYWKWNDVSFISHIKICDISAGEFDCFPFNTNKIYIIWNGSNQYGCQAYSVPFHSCEGQQTQARGSCELNHFLILFSYCDC